MNIEKKKRKTEEKRSGKDSMHHRKDNYNHIKVEVQSHNLGGVCLDFQILFFGF